MSKRLLLLEDEENLRFTLTFNLEAEGYRVDAARTLAEARALLDQTFDLYLLDVMLPDGSGVEICREVRARQIFVPVIFLTAKGGADNVVDGLDAGGDDYITKPFALKELLGRIQASLRRQGWSGDDGEAQNRTREVAFGESRVNFVTREVNAIGTVTTLTDLELNLLRYLADNRERPVSRGELLEQVWGVDAESNTRSVDNFIVRLRRLFERDPARPRHIVTVRGVGYQFVI
ncbi:MAG: response regulator transcription factor [Myxococcales bacterium]|nr:response regulator transcription factor [Myxococcales bacterium]